AEHALIAFVDGHSDRIDLDYRGGAAPIIAPPVAIDGQTGLAILSVRMPGPGERFVVHDMNLASERDAAPLTIPVAQGGRTVVLLRIEQLPAGSSVVVVRLQPPAGPLLFASLTFAARPMGQLAVSVRDERGLPAPVLMRLTSVVGARLWEPAGSVDYREMMNAITTLPIYGPGRGYPIWIPLRHQGSYWVVPSPFDMAIPAGEWEIEIVRGPEYAPVRRSVRVPEAGRASADIRLRRWVRMADRGWFSGDDHVHSRLMHSEDADKLLAFCRAVDLNVCNVLEMGDAARTWYPQRGFGPAFRAHLGDHWLVPGQEDPRSALGHAIGLNLTARVRDTSRYLLNDWVAGEIHRQGGLYGHTHVGSGVKELLTEREMALYAPFGIVDFASVMQAGLGTPLYYDFLNLGYRITATAGSDTPYGGTVGAVRTYAYCGKGRFNPDRWFGAVRAGRTFVSNGVMAELTVGGKLPGEALQIRPGQTVRVRARAFGLPGEWAPRRLEVVMIGRTVKAVEARGPAGADLAIDLPLPTGQGGWVVARAWGEDGSEALTSPVWLEREGFRSWSATDAHAIIARQMATLDEIDAALATASAEVAQPGRELDTYTHSIADRAPEVRERIARARAEYRRLLELAAAERRKIGPAGSN
ncbi:MAG: CehA/McbA family metallohydrolase, partial [Armatimonadetes bacterium]|nr:CehA/McbA family metallohydrolase [Armatimonadota bacterium]